MTAPAVEEVLRRFPIVRLAGPAGRLQSSFRDAIERLPVNLP